MITEGIIVDIDYNTNSCLVRIPVLENVASSDKVVAEGRILIQPGYYNNYKVNDCVWVGFVDYKFNQPLILGKIYNSNVDESNRSGGHLNIDTLNVTGDTATIPKETQLTNSKDYKSIEDIINELKYCRSIIDQQSYLIDKLINSINILEDRVGNAVTDVNGDTIADKNGEILAYKNKYIKKE